MSGAIIAIWPIALLIAAAIVGVAAVDELTIVRKTGTADDGVAVPVQRHW